jgi:hypothetical protein
MADQPGKRSGHYQIGDERDDVRLGAGALPWWARICSEVKRCAPIQRLASAMYQTTPNPQPTTAATTTAQ